MYCIEVNRELELINHSLEEVFSQIGRHNAIVEAMKYSVLGPSKRVRSLMMLQVPKITEQDPAKILPSVCAIELIHAASLVFDDLPCMDNALLRRGKPTVYRTFGEAAAILSALALLFEAFKMITLNANQLQIANLERVRVLVDLFDRLGVEGMVEGQFQDLLLTQGETEAEKIMNANKKKTAGFFEISLEIASVLCQCSEGMEEMFYRYARNVGLAFQIKDDLIDVHGCKDKDSNKDALKTTIVDLYGSEGAKNCLKNTIENAIHAIDELPHNDGLIAIARAIA